MSLRTNSHIGGIDKWTDLPWSGSPPPLQYPGHPSPSAVLAPGSQLQGHEFSLVKADFLAKVFGSGSKFKKKLLKHPLLSLKNPPHDVSLWLFSFPSPCPFGKLCLYGWFTVGIRRKGHSYEKQVPCRGVTNNNVSNLPIQTSAKCDLWL